MDLIKLIWHFRSKKLCVIYTEDLQEQSILLLVVVYSYTSMTLTLFNDQL